MGSPRAQSFCSGPQGTTERGSPPPRAGLQEPVTGFQNSLLWLSQYSWEFIIHRGVTGEALKADQGVNTVMSAHSCRAGRCPADACAGLSGLFMELECLHGTVHMVDRSSAQVLLSSLTETRLAELMQKPGNLGAVLVKDNSPKGKIISSTNQNTFSCIYRTLLSYVQ